MRRDRSIGSAVAILAATAGLVHAQAAYTIVASTQDPVPNLPLLAFADVGEASINQAGIVAFRAVLVDAEEAPSWSFWSAGPGAPMLFAMEGQPAQVGPGRVLGPPPLTVPSLNAAGETAAAAAVSGADVIDSSDEGLFLTDGAALQPLLHTAVTGQPHFWISRPAMNPAGRIALLTDDGRDALFVGSPAGGGGTGLARVARRDEPAPGLDQTLPTRFERFSDPTISPTGEVIVRAVARRLGDAPLPSGLWRVDADGTVTLLVSPGAPAPGLGSGVNFSELSRPSFDAAGHACFRAQLAGAPITRANDGTIWMETSAGLSLVAREGDPAPGVDGAMFKYISAPFAAGDGLIGFTATIDGPGIDETNNTGIWRGTPGALAPIVRRGWAAPRAGAGLVFERFASPVMNASGNVAFVAYLADADPATPHTKSFYVAAADGALHLVARESGFIPLDNCTHAQVERLAVHVGSRGDDGLGSPLNDAGQLVFEATLADGGEAVMVADLASRLWSCDLDRSGLVDVLDLLAFLDGWFASSSAADVTGAGGVDVFDLLAFLDCWFGGC